MNSPTSPAMAPSSELSTGPRRTFVMKNVLGLHARPSSLIVKTLQGFDCQVMVECGDAAADAQSIFGLLSLAAGYDSRLTFVAAGRDATKAIEAMQRLFESNFEDAY
jgi:phosphotransferase system HPr (HPr) family protein